jgi:hypothetical protein
VCCLKLAEALKREVPEFLISAVEVPKFGLCIRYSPLDVSDSKSLVSFIFLKLPLIALCKLTVYFSNEQ